MSKSPSSSPRSPRSTRRTAPPASGINRWLPQRTDYPSYQQWDTAVRAYRHIYEMQDRLDAAMKEITKLSAGGGVSGSGKAPAGTVSTDAGSVSATHIMGISVKAGIPADGQKLTYVAAEGQFVFK